MKFTIGTVSSNIEFEETMKLIKSSLLYADEIELIGMVEYAVFRYLPHQIYDAKELEQLLNGITPLLKSVDAPGGKEILEEIDNLSNQLKEFAPVLKKTKRRTAQEILVQVKMKEALEQGKEKIKSEIEKILDSQGSMAIRELLEHQVISVYDYNYKDVVLEELTGSYFGNLMNAMRNHTAYPLFDHVSADVIRSVVDTHILDIGRMNQEVLRHAGVASNILMTLPTLESASIDEILDFKKENQNALVNFKKAIYEFSEKIGSLPWDDDFQYDCIKLYSTEVAPKVAELNEISTDTSVVKNLGSRAIADAHVRKAAGFAVGGIAATVLRQNGLLEAFDVLRDIFLEISLLAISPQIASGFLKSIDLFNKSRTEVKQMNRDIQGNTMYYYYKATTEL